MFVIRDRLFNYTKVCAFSNFVSGLRLKLLPVSGTKLLSTSSNLKIRVLVCGSSEGVGQSLSLLLKMSPLIKELTLYDVKGTVGVAADLHHVNTKTTIKQFSKAALLSEALEDRDIVVITAGKYRGLKMTQTDLFKYNADIVREITDTMANIAPKAILCILTNPVNCLVPVAAGILKKACVFDPRKLFGITKVDCIRASKFAAELMCSNPETLTVPVIGGHSETTTLPIFSQATFPIDVPDDKLKELIKRVRLAGHAVLEAKKGEGTASLATAYSAAQFIFALCRAMKGDKDVVECAYVQSDLTDAAYFATPLVLGKMGMERNIGFCKLSPLECSYLMQAIQNLIIDIKIGESYLK